MEKYFVYNLVINITTERPSNQKIVINGNPIQKKTGFGLDRSTIDHLCTVKQVIEN